MKKDEKSKWNKYPTIEEQKEHFKSFSLLPIIIGAIICVLGILKGIEAAINARAFGPFGSWCIGGVVLGVVVWLVLRIFISSQVISVLYLEKISNDLEELKKQKQISDSIADVKNCETPVANESIVEDSIGDPIIEKEAVVPKIDPIEYQQSQDKIKQKAIRQLAEILENQDKETFYNELNKWQNKNGNNLLYWDVAVYNRINKFINSVSFTSVYDSEMREIRTYKIQDEDYENIKAMIKAFCESELK